ncbi:putative aspartyl protease/Flp pilus assembly protein TadD [Sphingomonas sp. SORGH_AS870]|uniref:aspartyl protease family protein n=1 Tax=Sphingomonas sp. SORGH_AS_0870 TaxID=3041801 RepID=UPI002865F3EB|nr:aspartyl protease family protein [Sphingomonas sp. SORGH_AS_0870]MDR6145036.1 putative aspartyl protease/Flp pilus assembly protein TadD [Sphingomonas sp. SORGH_AS_0870]
MMGTMGRYVVAAGLLAGGAAPAMAATGCQVGMMAAIPVTMQGLRPVVETQINGRPAPFLLDSGAFYSNIAPPVAREFGLSLSPLPDGYRVNGVGGSSEARVTTVRRFTLAGFDLAHVEFIVSGSDVGETGLLGQNVLGLADVEYDLPGGMVRLFKPSNCAKAAMAYWTKGQPFFEMPIEPRDSRQHHTVGTVELDGAKLRATFDTGADGTVLTLRAAARAGVHPGDPGVEPAGWSTGIGHHVVKGWVARFKLLRIGNEELHNVRLHIADLGGLDTDMLLGADYFVSHRLYVSNAQHRLYFTYNGGRLFDAAAHVDPAASGAVQVVAEAAAPTDAEGYSRRGAMLQTQHDLPGAIDAFTHAMTLAPRDPRFPRQRALAYLEQRRPVLAIDDLNTTLTLAPADTRARFLRAELRQRAGNPAGAVADLDQISATLPREDMQRLQIARLYADADAFTPAIAQYGLWLDTHRDDARRGAALNGRCWARMLANVELDKAMSDCNAAIHAVPGNPSYLDSRGFVRLRRHEDQAALTDFDAALAIDPKRAWALYGRAIVEQRLGRTAEADRDRAAAIALDRHMPDRIRTFGIA